VGGAEFLAGAVRDADMRRVLLGVDAIIEPGGNMPASKITLNAASKFPGVRCVRTLMQMRRDAHTQMLTCSLAEIIHYFVYKHLHFFSSQNLVFVRTRY
jgi:hypothetical protein